MASRRNHLRAQRKPQASRQEDKGVRPQGIKKERLLQLRRSKRISKLQERIKEGEPDRRLVSPSTQENHSLPQLSKGQKRPRAAEYLMDYEAIERPRKQLRPSPRHLPRTQTIDQEIASCLSATKWSGIDHWRRPKHKWPVDFFETNRMHLFARKKSTASLRRKRSDASFATSSTPIDLQAEKSAPYKNPSYEAVLEKEAYSYMDEYKAGITEESEVLCQTLLDSAQPTPKDTIFRDDIFVDTCRRLRGKNEARIFKDCTPLIFPWAEAHASLSANRDLDIAIESVNERWDNSDPITKPRPQPDYAVGFRRSAFSEDQLKKLQPYIGETSYSSYFMGTYYMHFPFFTCEVKCGLAGLDIADRQNLHSMTLAIRGIVELFRAVNRAEELHREVLAFSVSHDHETVRIYGHYPVIDGTKISYWRYTLRKYDFTERRGMEKWTAYKFVKNVYDIFMPALFSKISSAIDHLLVGHGSRIDRASSPQISETTGLSQQYQHQSLTGASGPQISETTRLSQQYQHQSLTGASGPQISETTGLSQQYQRQSLTDASISQSSLVDLLPITPDMSTQTGKPASKKKKGKV